MATGWLIVLVGLGGALGANARFWLGRWISTWEAAKDFPLATMLINVSGSLVLGWVFASWRRDDDAFLFWGVGVCGGFTTFSTFSLETLALLNKGQVGYALLNVAGSAVAGVAAVWLASGGRGVG